MRLNRFLYFIAAALLVSCSGENSVPAGIVKPGEMQKIMWDIAKAQALATAIAHKDSLVNELAETKILNEKIFSIHHITEEQFSKTYNWYTNHPDLLKNIFDSISIQNQRENEAMTKRKIPPLIRDIKKLKHPL